MSVAFDIRFKVDTLHIEQMRGKGVLPSVVGAKGSRAVAWPPTLTARSMDYLPLEHGICGEAGSFGQSFQGTFHKELSG